MTRLLTVLRVTITVAGPWLVGDPTATGDVRVAPLRDSKGALEVPATSLAGSLRHHLRRRPGIDETTWLGEARGANDDNRSGGPSRLRLLGVHVSGGDRTVFRTTTAVDRSTGSARARHLRREEHVDATTILTVYLSHDGGAAEELLSALVSWRPAIGRRRSNGWGRAAVTEVRHAQVDLTDRGQLVAWLAGGGRDQVDALVADQPPRHGEPVSGPEDLVRMRFTVPDGIHVGTGEDERGEVEAADDSDHRMPIAAIAQRDGVPYVPASSWRGVLRRHAEFVLTSLGCQQATVQCAVGVVFGDVGRRGRLVFHDAILTTPTGESAATVKQKHVGIDRVTGGARPNLLFAERVATGVVELRVSVDPEATEELPGWARSLLGHAVQDLTDGFLAVGGRTTRGLGTLEPTGEPAIAPAAAGIDQATVAAWVEREVSCRNHGR